MKDKDFKSVSDNKEYTRLKDNIDEINIKESEPEMNDSYQQLDYIRGKTKIILKFPSEQKREEDTERMKQEIHSILATELQLQLRKISQTK